MRKVKLYIACSLDGYIARKDGAVDWLFTDQDYGYSEFIATVDTVIMGRKTYEHSLLLGPPYPHEGKRTYVFTRISPPPQTDDAVHFVSQDPEDLVEELKSGPGLDIWLVGGSELIRSFLDADLIDEYLLFVHPLILGSGIPLFPEHHTQIPLRLVKSYVYITGLLHLHYVKA